MNQAAEYVQKLSTYIPEFASYWESDDSSHNFGEASSIYGVFSDFSNLVVRRLKSKTLKEPQSLFAFIESVVIDGGEPANAACTCFLENILNATPSAVDPDSFVPFLGEQSRRFCVSWDSFTGIKTKGLHQDA